MYSHHEIESAVAISGDLHGHQHFDLFVVRNERFASAQERWQLCIDAAIEVEDSAKRLSVEWGETHDYFSVIEAIVEQIVGQESCDVTLAVRSALYRGRFR
jgi:hypothetical protein